MSEHNLLPFDSKAHENKNNTHSSGRIIGAWERTEPDGTTRDMFTIAVKLEGEELGLDIPQDTFETMYRVANPEPLPVVDKASLRGKDLRQRNEDEKEYNFKIENRLNNVTYCARGVIGAMGYDLNDPMLAAEQIARLVISADDQTETLDQTA